jgi:hypothetical protein
MNTPAPMEKQDEIGGDTAKAMHTPGPWVARHLPTDGAFTVETDREHAGQRWWIADMGNSAHIHPAEREANARLKQVRCGGEVFDLWKSEAPSRPFVFHRRDFITEEEEKELFHEGPEPATNGGVPVPAMAGDDDDLPF